MHREEEEEVDDSEAVQVFDQRKKKRKRRKRSSNLNVFELPFTRLDFNTSSNFDYSRVGQQRESSKEKGDSGARQSQKQAARKKTATKDHVESSEGEDELEDTSSSANERSSSQGKQDENNLYNPQTYTSYRCSRKDCTAIFKPRDSRMCDACGVMYFSSCNRHGITHKPTKRCICFIRASLVGKRTKAKKRCK